ncbi:ATPase-AAA-core domain-containing protein [Mycena venus]|uniref:ATPase-AAA-core domain-containing protein n=1 Tax=Mycena venus TaxID=2733690 RepID=A0A8H7CE35_9AGAR|nr:ATPase-AAA-core domain-containing protein [Mycena venus]
MLVQPTIAKIRLNNVTTCLSATANTLESVKQNKNECVQLIEQTHGLLTAIIAVYIKSNTGGELPPSMLNQIGRFTETLHKICVFVEAQQNGSKLKKIFWHTEVNTLLKDCKTGLQEGYDFFQATTTSVISVRDTEKYMKELHQEVLDMIETLSISDKASSGKMMSLDSGPTSSSNSIFMLPSNPMIFHGREAELATILKLFTVGNPRIAILGGGGMGKTSLARAVVHHREISSRYEQHRFFVACDTVTTGAELVALIGAQLELKPCKDLPRQIIQHLSDGPPCLLILDNLETVWEPTDSREEIEEFLSLLSEVTHLALMVDNVATFFV